MEHFDLQIYRMCNKDLQNMNDTELLTHFNTFGINENRIYSMDLMCKNMINLRYFDINYYIDNNKDLVFDTKELYVKDYLENRLDESRNISFELTEFKKEKQQLFLNKLINVDVSLNYLKEEDKSKYKIGINETESANEWGEDSDITNLINQNEIVLNIGAGYRLNKPRFFSLKNVINTEVFAYPTTDVICDGEDLPFKDNSFDVVLSLAVLEHVKHPWKHAEEMIRVLKPGGTVYADVPFLQPYHGYPYHYYNMTTAGLQNLFDKKIKIIKHCVEPWAKPVYTLTWFLNKYCEFLDEETKNKFKKLTVEQIINNGNNTDLDYVSKMDKTKEEIIASATTLIGQKL